MDIVTLEQLLTVGGFLGLLGAALFVVKANKGTLKTKLTQDRRMALGEVTSLGPDTRAMVLKVDQQDFLIVTSKRHAPVVTPIVTPMATAQPQPVPSVAETSEQNAGLQNTSQHMSGGAMPITVPQNLLSRISA